MNRSLEIYEREIVEMDDIGDKWHHFEVNNHFTETTNAIATALHLYKNIFQTLTQAIHSARLEHLRPSLLTTSSLQNIIRQINNIHPGYEFPIPIMHARTDKLSEMVSVKLDFRNNNFLAEIRIPLLNKFATEVYRMHPLPVPQQHQNHLVSAYVQP